jgi:alcohol dehydrogenase (cytochrome c)
MTKLAALLLLPVALAPAFAQTADAGRRQFESRCATCHGGDGMGGELGPPIVFRLARLSDEELTKTVRAGIPSGGMPASDLAPGEMTSLVTFLRTLRPGRRPPARRQVQTTDGRTLDGLVINETILDLQLRTGEGASTALHLLRPAGNGRFREVTSQKDWTSYNGDLRGNRYSTVDQINKTNASHLASKWVFTAPNAPRLQTTPVVVQGVMYITSGNECYALDAGSGREIWHYQRPRTKGLVGNAAGGFNRGVASAGDRVFMVTDNAHLLALNRFTGDVVWETEMADWRQNYNATSAPLAVNGMVVSGTAGGEQGARGFLAAYDQSTGKEIWRFWTVPLRGEPGSETWKGTAIDHPSATTWFTGSYDPDLDTLYWQTGNPGPDYDGSIREGDNLYSDCILALDPKTGKLKWYYQTTPHDVWDWDATEPIVLVDANWQGQPRKLLIQANRNGFFYVFDRRDGKLLLAKSFVKKITWAKEVGADGRPVTLHMPKAGAGTQVCPSQDGATNWYATSFNPGTGLFYVQTLEKCGIYTVTQADWKAGRGYMAGSQRSVPGEIPQKILRALDINTGAVEWELPQIGPGGLGGGVLSTATGVVFVCDDSGMLMAVDASNGKILWSYQTSQLIKASPMTYVFDGKQYVAISAGSTILAFALGD